MWNGCFNILKQLIEIFDSHCVDESQGDIIKTFRWCGTISQYDYYYSAQSSYSITDCRYGKKICQMERESPSFIHKLKMHLYWKKKNE